MNGQILRDIISSKNENGNDISMCASHADLLYNYLEHIRKNNIQGDIVECGVWCGGVILAIMEYLNYYQIFDKKIWLYDTFNGLTEPNENDYHVNQNKEIDNANTKKFWFDNKISDTVNNWCLCDLDRVKKNLSKSNFPKENLVYVVGDVCVTLQEEKNIPEKISLLRLDTDWYESTKAELLYLYPKVTKNGVVIVDDYNYWNGSRLAVDEQIDYKKFDFINDNINPLGFIKS